MSFIRKSIQEILGFFGISRQEDLPEIPDAPPEGTPVIKGADLDSKHVTFSPAKEFIPEYQFEGVPHSPLKGKTPQNLIKELQSICPEGCINKL